MPTILAIETSTEIASAAILFDGRLKSAEAAGVQTHSQTLLPMVQNLLQQAGLRLSDCDAIAFGAGPGSFTGVRTACGIAQGLAFGLGLPVLPISTLLAMAEQARALCGATQVMPILDARMGEVYWARYGFDGAWQTLDQAALANPAALPTLDGVFVCGNGLALCPGAHLVSAQNPVAESINPVRIMPHAQYIARLGQIAFADGHGLPASEAQPLYLRNKVAQTMVERMAERAQRGGAR
jgi:tRNA threonylcarbamoyladenosine biosynthesis protein TsaB